MKRNCNGCAALEEDITYCSLGYRLKSVLKMPQDVFECRPLEECPKPKTIKQYMELKGF